ncbi:phospholipase [Helicobacter didelphidarum]|uniref:Phosphatidylcholine 1-acylhydrolase n=2 Tax=Helicobacter didelphidarum TaxID=2040648 RepID=A0A3D8IMW8_9HELI|nr:phospholipase [Helicobacter didelphidarum]
MLHPLVFATHRDSDVDLTNSTSVISQKKESFWTKTKKHFFDTELYKQRAQIAEKSYQYYMQLLEHEGTYFIYQYSLPPHGIYGNNIPSELKFQMSFRVPLWRGALWSKGTIFFAYTQQMWFQQFNNRYSNPVRDTNYKPSIFYSYPGDWKLFGGKIKELRIGFIHFSNGIGGDECVRTSPTYIPSECRSRSAGNRILFDIIWEADYKSHIFGIHLSVWPYIPKRRDNLDLPEYMGYANTKLYYRYKRHLVELHISPIISDYTKYHGSMRLGYAFALNRYVSLYGQYFYGYGDSLYEYNILSQRIGVGLRVTSF